MSFFSIYFNALRFYPEERASPAVVAMKQQQNAMSVGSLPEDVMHRNVLSFLKIEDVVHLDSALANHKLRIQFHSCLNGTVLMGVVDYRHLDWCIGRQCSTEVLSITSTLDNVDQITRAPSFEVLKVCATAAVPAHALHRILTNGKKNQTLDVRSFYTMHVDQFMSLGSDLPLLEINAQGNKFLQEDVLVALVKRCPLLRVIDATGWRQYSKLLPLALAEHCPHLCKVYLQTSDRNNDICSGYCELFRSCKLLKVVHCAGDVRITNLETLAGHCKDLTSVRLHGTNYFRSGEEPSAPAVAALEDTALVSLVQNNPHIESLELFSFRRLDDDTLLAVAQFLPNLHTFRLDCHQASLSALASIRATCTKLTTFEVYARHRIAALQTTENYYRYLQMCILTYLSIHPGELSDAQFVTIAQANPNLRSLYIVSSNQVQTTTMLTSTALCEALSYLPKLELFFAHTSGPPPNALRLEDNDLYALARHCPQLTSVHISGHSNLSNDAISALSKLPLLRKLHASECSNLLDSGLAAIAEGCPLLEDLNLSYCERISQIVINALALHSRKLISIELWRCPKVTNSAI